MLMLIDAVGSTVARVLVLGGEILAIVMTLLRTRESYVRLEINEDIRKKRNRISED